MATAPSGEVCAVVRLYGIRHHGPGSALALRRVLLGDPPDVVLVEGPREADAIVSLVADPAMRAPVTLLGYELGHPDNAVFYPFASFSPEWVALQWAADARVPVRFIDLALANTLANWPVEVQTTLDDAQRDVHYSGEQRPRDPLGDLAHAAGYDDAERWWEDVVEHRDGSSLFEAVSDAMTVLREAYEPDFVPSDPVESRREAQMRTGIRTAIRDGFTRIAVVCGAWHVPALFNATDLNQTRSDTALLRGMPKTKVAVTWVPWTHRRLAAATGYGAGVTSPGWYHHLFAHPGSDTVARWFSEAARVLRTADYATSAADVVEATRLATALASLRGRPLAGLAEVDDAARAVLGDGTDTPMRLLSNELVVGTVIGQVPPHTPMVPLARNLALEQKRLRLAPEAAPRLLELDLRKPRDLSRSRLLHQLIVLRVPWGREVDGRRSVGTFRETWQLCWEPELPVRLIEASAMGTTVHSAAAAALLQRAGESASLGELTAAVERCLLGDLVSILPNLVQLIADRATLDLDISRLMAAVPALARTLRYGDVRGTDARTLAAVLAGMISRISAGLALACVHLDDDSAAAMGVHMLETQAALSMLGRLDADDLLAVFHRALGEVIDRDAVHASLQGRATRSLADAGRLGATDVDHRVARALSRGTPPTDGAHFVEGFLGSSGTVLIHDTDLLGVVDRWLATLDPQSFIETLPLLRRTFATFERAERRQIGDQIRGVQGLHRFRGVLELDAARVAAGLATIAQLLGVQP